MPTWDTSANIPIRLAWFSFVLPALVLNYFGQGALLLHDPQAIQNPFYLLAPAWTLIPMVLLATAATVIASQAVISGAFSVAKQSVHMGFLPRVEIRQTSDQAQGQIYVPLTNWTLYLAVVFLVFTFQSSSNLAAAYGIAVTGTMTITTVLIAFVIVLRWRWPMLVSIPMIAVLFRCRCHVFSGQFDEDSTRRLVPGRRCNDLLYRAHDMETRPWIDVRKNRAAVSPHAGNA